MASGPPMGWSLPSLLGDSFSHQLATSGPMARTPQDLWRLLSVQAAAPRGPHHEPLRPPDFDAPATPKIGWYADFGGALPIEDGILALCEEALSVLEGLGCEIVSLPPPNVSDLWQSWVTLRAWAVANNLGPHLETHPDKLNKQAVWEIETGRALSGSDIHRASVIRSDWYRAFHAMTEADFCVLPTAQMFPFSATLDWPKDVAGTPTDTYHRWMEVVIPVSLIGIPAVSLPAGFSRAGLPMGIQLFGKRGQDADLLGLAHHYHLATGWPDRKPPAAEWRVTCLKVSGRT